MSSLSDDQKFLLRFGYLLAKCVECAQVVAAMLTVLFHEFAC